MLTIMTASERTKGTVGAGTKVAKLTRDRLIYFANRIQIRLFFI